MVKKWCCALLCFLCTMLFYEKENENKKHYYQTFMISAKYAASHSFYVVEEDQEEGYLLLDDVKKNFKKAWSYLENQNPMLISVVLFDVNSELPLPQKGQGVEIAIKIKGRVHYYEFQTRYILKRRTI